ncbi:type II toxin-antitoxin system RelE/ParE family toxin [Fischerella thermalis]|uniref:type II toxin-antitoxin system RelE/ParE family toxin n=1 Tax=Fischerella thermalis TaxID=372787 RepID=UPI000C7FD166|nr:type II toxin-antitoxin system RelE/ParE family toxin [Fischerella thermalis]MBF1990108.1 type II toxin-antitoxin system RelE/ParE family toxin [Fischerella thermalis M58_A2018_009]MBF2062548.1 type II toxin-antitoxin system RelE/ParE family toxin [Fischerella thermalis M66_A2018_004]MBF2068654.1 type II toxin-antitoxin system RelE/ParE family toxin [Fischerella thermalis M48_A2018_028]PLZ89058.1 plasmid stabilization protein [Fischerella thermalis CCMEE 5194]
MNRYRLSQQAEQDLEDIWTYLAQQNQLAADKQIAQILNRFPMLAQFPDMGKKRDDLMKELKSFPVKPYVVFYIKITDGVEIFRVLHQSRDIEGEFS